MTAETMPLSVRLHLYLVQDHRLSGNPEAPLRYTGPRSRRLTHKYNHHKAVLRRQKNERARARRASKKEE